MIKFEGHFIESSQEWWFSNKFDKIFMQTK